MHHLISKGLVCTFYLKGLPQPFTRFPQLSVCVYVAIFILYSSQFPNIIFFFFFVPNNFRTCHPIALGNMNFPPKFLLFFFSWLILIIIIIIIMAIDCQHVVSAKCLRLLLDSTQGL